MFCKSTSDSLSWPPVRFYLLPESGSRLLLFCLLQFLLITQTPAYQVENFPARIIGGSIEQRAETAELTEKIYHNLEYLFGPPPSDSPRRPTLRILLADKPPTAEFMRSAPPFSVIIEPGTPEPARSFAIARQVLAQRLSMPRMDNNSAELHPHEPPEWIAAAAAFAAMQAVPGQKINPRPDYRPLDKLFHQGRFPDPLSLVTTPVSPREQEYFELFCMQSHFLLNLLRNSPETRSSSRARPSPAPILRETALGAPPALALRRAFEQINRSDYDLEEWYRARAPEAARRSRRDIDTERMLDELLYILTFHPESDLKEMAEDEPKSPENNENNFPEGFSIIESSTECYSIYTYQRPPASELRPLREMEAGQDQRLKGGFKAERLQLLMWMYPRAPKLLRESLQHYMEAIRVFDREGPSEDFIDNLQRGDRLLQQQLPRQRKIEERLRQYQHLQDSFIPGYIEDNRLLEPIKEEEERSRLINPRLRELLEQHQK